MLAAYVRQMVCSLTAQQQTPPHLSIYLFNGKMPPNLEETQLSGSLKGNIDLGLELESKSCWGMAQYVSAKQCKACWH